MEFEQRGQVFDVQGVMVRQVCDVLTRNPQMLRCVVRSSVSTEVFRVFLSAIEGNAVEVTNENVDGLWALCDELQFWSLLRRGRVFTEALTYPIERQNARIEELEKQFQELSQHFQTWRQPAAQAQDGLERKMKTITADVGALNRAVSDQGIAQFQRGWATRLDSAIVSGLPFIFGEFRGKRFALLRQGDRDNFGVRDFHDRCDGHANTLILIEDTKGNIFGAFTPIEWESRLWVSDMTFMFPITATHTSAVTLPLAVVTPTTPDWTGRCFSRMLHISK
jgi:hypothetical protein